MRTITGTIVFLGCVSALAGCSPNPTNEKTVPPGTNLEVELLDNLSSAENAAGDAVSARVAHDIVVSGQVLIPAGSTVSGRVTAARGLEKIGGRAVLRVEFNSLDLPTGSTSIQAAFYRECRSETNHEVALAGVGSGGALLGRLSQSAARDTAVGAVDGGVAGTAIAAGAKAQEIVLPAGSRLALHLQGKTTIRVEA